MAGAEEGEQNPSASCGVESEDREAFVNSIPITDPFGKVSNHRHSFRGDTKGWLDHLLLNLDSFVIPQNSDQRLRMRRRRAPLSAHGQEERSRPFQ